MSIYKTLIYNKEYILSKQLLRSGNSIGANVKEGIKDYTKTDFLYKMNIALKEANETDYCLKSVIQSEILKDNDIISVFRDCKDICKILNRIVVNWSKKE